jgi:hypothetical protein
VQAVVTSAGIEAHAAIIKREARRRSIIHTGHTLQEIGRQETENREELLAGALAELYGHSADGNGMGKPTVLLRPMQDLLSEPDEVTRWLVEERLPAGGISLLAGKPKSGKSTLARCLAFAVARGEPLLGFRTYQGKVFYLALEEKRAEVRSHFKALGATPEDPLFWFIAPSPQDGLAQLREAVERERPALIIIDPLLKLVRVKDANDYAVVLKALEPLLSLARDTGAHVLAVHHLGKGDRQGGDSILGSTAIFGTVDTALLLKRTEHYRALSSIQRYGEDLDDITLVLDPHSRMVTAGPSRQEMVESQAQTEILEMLKGKSAPAEEAEIHEAVEGRRGVKVRALRKLVETGKVIRSGEGKRGNPFRYTLPTVSSSLVPDIYGEPENQKPKDDTTPRHTDGYSGSHEISPSHKSGESLEPETEEVIIDVD